MKKRSGDSSRLGDVSEMLMQKTPLGTPLDWDNPLNNDLALHLAMNEGHGNKVQDLSMNGNHGMLKNMAFPPTVASGWNPGQTGAGLNFDGTNDYIDCGNNPVLELVGDFSASACITPKTVTGVHNIIGNGRPSFDGWELQYRDDKIWFNTYQAAATQSTVSSSVLNIDEPVVITISKSGADVNIYVDGVDATDIHPAHIDPIYNSRHTFVGRYVFSAAYHFNGSIDQPRIQSRAWTAKEVRDYAINPWQVYLQP